eukprot:scaffold7247_cov28-Tisochrysis_lutea.AAC.1
MITASHEGARQSRSEEHSSASSSTHILFFELNACPWVGACRAVRGCAKSSGACWNWGQGRKGSGYLNKTPSAAWRCPSGLSVRPVVDGKECRTGVGIASGGGELGSGVGVGRGLGGRRARTGSRPGAPRCHPDTARGAGDLPLQYRRGHIAGAREKEKIRDDSTAPAVRGEGDEREEGGRST